MKKVFMFLLFLSIVLCACTGTNSPVETESIQPENTINSSSFENEILDQETTPLPKITSKEIYEQEYLRADWTKDQMEDFGFESKINEPGGETYYFDEHIKYIYFDWYNEITPVMVEVYGEYHGPRGFSVGDTFDDVLALFPQEVDWQSSTNGVFYGHFDPDGEQFDNAMSGHVLIQGDDPGEKQINILTDVLPGLRIFFENDIVTHFTFFLIGAS